jgi:hypothetical protein
MRKGDWMQTISGGQFWPLDPRPEEIHLEDIAHSLSMICRFNGHCNRFYSVAEHCVLVSSIVPNEYKAWALLHDASEAYIADIVRPAKRFIEGYKDIEKNIMRSVCVRFGLDPVEPECVKIADQSILADEADQVMGPKPKDWFLPYAPSGQTINFLCSQKAKALFLSKASDLGIV